jgi:hypothetical protein
VVAVQQEAQYRRVANEAHGLEPIKPWDTKRKMPERSTPQDAKRARPASGENPAPENKEVDATMEEESVSQETRGDATEVLKVVPKFVGVYPYTSQAKSGHKWSASIRHGGKTKFLGYFEAAEDAARAYDAAARELRGEAAHGALLANGSVSRFRVNFPTAKERRRDKELAVVVAKGEAAVRAAPKFFGVKWDKLTHKWSATIAYKKGKLDRKGSLTKKTLGHFETAEDAARAYDAAARELRGKAAHGFRNKSWLNFPTVEEQHSNMRPVRLSCAVCCQSRKSEVNHQFLDCTDPTCGMKVRTSNCDPCPTTKTYSDL